MVLLISSRLLSNMELKLGGYNMSMIEWAENEIRLATKVDQECMGEGDKDSIDYVKACYNAALDAYKTLCD